MLQLTNKRFLIYIFLLILLGTINNQNLKEINLFQINEINITGLEVLEKKELSKKLDSIYFKNLFFLDRSRIEEIFKNNRDEVIPIKLGKYIRGQSKKFCKESFVV